MPWPQGLPEPAFQASREPGNCKLSAPCQTDLEPGNIFSYGSGSEFKERAAFPRRAALNLGGKAFHPNNAVGLDRHAAQPEDKALLAFQYEVALYSSGGCERAVAVPVDLSPWVGNVPAEGWWNALVMRSSAPRPTAGFGSE